MCFPLSENWQGGLGLDFHRFCVRAEGHVSPTDHTQVHSIVGIATLSGASSSDHCSGLPKEMLSAALTPQISWMRQC